MFKRSMSSVANTWRMAPVPAHDGQQHGVVQSVKTRTSLLRALPRQGPLIHSSPRDPCHPSSVHVSH